jgi:hypothetical protein
VLPLFGPTPLSPTGSSIPLLQRLSQDIPCKFIDRDVSWARRQSAQLGNVCRIWFPRLDNGSKYT